MNNIDDILKKINEDPNVADVFENMRDKVLAQQEDELIKQLKSARAILLTEMMSKYYKGKGLEPDFDKESLLIIKDISEIIKMMKKERLIEEGA